MWSKAKKAEYDREWRKTNPDYNREYCRANKDKIAKKNREWRQANKAKVAGYHREYKKAHKAECAERARNYRQNNAQARLTNSLRARMRKVLKGNTKSATTIELLGCTIEKLKQHIESQFQEGMTWEKYMNGEIHIDHIRPCISFDLTDPEQQKECFGWRNLQPLWAEDNLSKGSNLNYGEEAGKVVI